MNINIKDFKVLKELYNKALKDGKSEFVFKENTLLTSYAKYLIEYLNSKFKDIK